ncbi:hypothetical protein [Paenibacillus caui]|uniref:hypothetical protein n=1 Tax=Paenibacillus caui TaxID=2873927 RepID=UPI001CA8B678|nr:hypothetical protein [Paenibacillus caui]
MISLGLWILLGYGLAAAVVHWLYSRSNGGMSGSRGRSIHYVLITRNHGRQLEWYLRAICWYAGLRSTHPTVTLIDEDSEDDTLAIAERMRRFEGIHLQVIKFSGVLSKEELERHSPDFQGESVLFIDLRQPGEASKIPYVHVS